MFHQQHGLRLVVLALPVVGAHGFWFSGIYFWVGNFFEDLDALLSGNFFETWACLIQGVTFGCVWNERGLRQQIELYETGILRTCKIPRSLRDSDSTRIDICATEITLSEPLDISNRGFGPIEIYGDRNGGISTLSGGGSTRILQGSFPETRRPDISFRALTFKDGKADNGGLVFLTGSSNVKFSSCTFEGGAATESGGAVSISGDGSCGFYGSTFISNTAQNGGALSIENSRVGIGFAEFVSNAATGNGGAIFVDGASVDIGNSAFKSNLADGNGADVYIADDDDPGLAGPPNFQAEGPGSYVKCIYDPDIFSYGVFFCDSADTDIADLLTEQGAGVDGNQLHSNTICFENTDLSLDTEGRCDAL